MKPHGVVKKCEAKEVTLQLEAAQNQARLAVASVCTSPLDGARCTLVKANEKSIQDIVAKFQKMVGGRRCKVSDSARTQLGVAMQLGSNTRAIAELVTDNGVLGVFRQSYDSLVARIRQNTTEEWAHSVLGLPKSTSSSSNVWPSNHRASRNLATGKGEMAAPESASFSNMFDDYIPFD